MLTQIVGVCNEYSQSILGAKIVQQFMYILVNPCYTIENGVVILFKSGIWLLIASVPVHCFSITFRRDEDFATNFMKIGKAVLCSFSKWVSI